MENNYLSNDYENRMKQILMQEDEAVNIEIQQNNTIHHSNQFQFLSSIKDTSEHKFPDWLTIDPKAFPGVLGVIVDLLHDRSTIDPVAVAITFLVLLKNLWVKKEKKRVKNKA